MDSILAIVITVVSGVLVFIIGEILNTIWLKPLYEFKTIKSKIAYELSYDAGKICNVLNRKNCNEIQKREYEEARERIRALACELDGYIETISWFNIGIPSRKKLKKAVSDLFYLSHLLEGTDRDDLTEKSVRNSNIVITIKRNVGIYGSKKEKIYDLDEK